MLINQALNSSAVQKTEKRSTSSIPKGRRLCYNSKQLRNTRRRAFQATPQFKQDYRFRAGVEAAMSQFDRRTRVKPLRVRASKTSPSVPLSKPPESTSSGPLRSATAKTAAFQTRIRPFGLFYTLYTPAEGRSTSSEAGSPLFWSKSGFCPLTLSNRSVSQEMGRFELLRNYQL